MWLRLLLSGSVQLIPDLLHALLDHLAVLVIAGVPMVTCAC